MLLRAWRNWADLWRANREHLRWLLLAGLLINVLGLVIPLFTIIVYDRVVGNAAYATLWALAIGLAIGVALEMLLRQARVLAVEHVGARWDRHLDLHVFQGVLRTSLAQPPQVGAVLSRYRDVLAARDFLSSAYLLPVADLPFILLFLAAIALLGGPIVLVALGFGLALLALSFTAYVAARRYHLRQIRDNNAKVTLLAESLAAMETLRRPRSGLNAAGRFAALAESSAADAAQARLRQALTQSLAPGINALATAATLVTGVYLIEAQAMTTGALIGCSMLVSRCVMLFGSAAALANRHEDFSRAMTELGALLHLPEERLSRKLPKVKRVRLSAPEFVLSRAGFRRAQADRSVLEEVSLTIPPLQMVALVGRAGAGKSTLLRLLAGRIAVTSGSLVAGGVPVTEERLAWLAGCVGYKAQEPQFLSMTVGELLADSGERATPAQRLQALREAGLAPALAAGELTLATPLGPFGAGVSGGQRQMLGLACALLQGEDVLLLDEPTLGLDSAALQQVLELLRRLKGQRTIVMATHAPELINLADRLILVGDGKVLADGPREKLLVVPSPGPAARQFSK